LIHFYKRYGLELHIHIQEEGPGRYERRNGRWRREEEERRGQLCLQQLRG